LFEEPILTGIERQVATLAVQGLTDSEIAASLLLKEPQVKERLQSIYGKLSTPDRLALVLYAIDQAMGKASPSRDLAVAARAGVPMLSREVA
jgi:DNA-binding NarL/FixJ family response regulator